MNFYLISMLMINRKVNTTDTKDILDMYYNRHSDLCCCSLSDRHNPVSCDSGAEKEKYLLLIGATLDTCFI